MARSLDGTWSTNTCPISSHALDRDESDQSGRAADLRCELSVCRWMGVALGMAGIGSPMAAKTMPAESRRSLASHARFGGPTMSTGAHLVRSNEGEYPRG